MTQTNTWNTWKTIKITQDWREDGFVYLTRGNERRVIGQGRANTVSATNDTRPTGLTDGQALWNHATPTTVDPR